MDYTEWHDRVIELMARRLGVTKTEAAGECQNIEEMHADGLTPNDAEDELCHAIASSM